MEPEQLRNSYMAVGAGQIQRTMTHVILQHTEERPGKEKKNNMKNEGKTEKMIKC